MLEIKSISKTFNAGTVNEKKALRGLSLTLNDGDFVTGMQFPEYGRSMRDILLLMERT